MDSVELLRGLSDQFGVSGLEGEIRDWIYTNIRDRVDDIQIDVLGNLMTTINPGRDLVMMLDAHMDEIGIMVSYVEEGGFLRFAPIGGWDSSFFLTNTALWSKCVTQRWGYKTNFNNCIPA